VAKPKPPALLGALVAALALPLSVGASNLIDRNAQNIKLQVNRNGDMRGPGNGGRYRIIVNGPGVTPDVMWVGNGLHDFDRRNPDDVTFEQLMNGVLDSILNGDKFCRQH
jgi:hypothetical protein